MAKFEKVNNCISLIGMPGVGKSTVGVILAKLAGLDFLDTDVVIQQLENRTLQNIINHDGYHQLRKIEENVILSMKVSSCVISTGGSAVYSDRSMAKLGALGPLIYLKLDLDTLNERISETPDRGIASAPGKTFKQIFNERTPLYEKCCTHEIDTSASNAQIVAKRIIDLLRINPGT